MDRKAIGIFVFLSFALLWQKSNQLPNCKTVVWIGHNADEKITKCWDLNDGAHWYGGGITVDQKWPINAQNFAGTPAVPGGDDQRSFPVDSRFWLSSSGYALKVADDLPLFVGMFNGQLCLTVENRRPYASAFDFYPRLAYEECRETDVPVDLTTFYSGLVPMLFDKPYATPDERLFRRPVWSTFPAIRKKLDANTLKDYADKIKRSSDAGGTIVLGVGWESCMGEFQFLSTIFPNPKETFGQLRSSGFDVALTVHPFVSASCQSTFRTAKSKGYLVTRKSDGMPAELSFDGFLAALLDFTVDPKGGMYDWYRNRLTTLATKVGVDSFVFEYGQTSWLDEDSVLFGRPDDYAERYAETASQFGRSSIVSIARRAQKYPIFVKMPRKSSNSWEKNGIRSVIPNVLQMGLAGYPFVLTDVIGGSENDRADPTLYIRWLQLATFMPAMHFSVGSWEYEQPVPDIAKKMMKVREDNMHKILAAANESVVTGRPMIRPVWWTAPRDNRARMVDDQFLVGDDLMVAPIVHNETRRIIYIPPGTWYDEVHKKPQVGPQEVGVTVALEELMYFTKLKD